MRRLIAVMFVLPLMAATIARGDESLIQESLIQEVSLPDLERNGSRFYLAGIVGSSFATLTSPGLPSATEPLFTSGGAAGVAFEMWDRAWRLEVEGRARDPITGNAEIPGGTSTLSATGGWSTTVNLWRDYDVTEWLSCYVGGGIGGGGYRLGVNQDYPQQDSKRSGLGTVGGFAWQAGGGIAYVITDRITLDLGYRFFDLGSGGVNAQTTQTDVLIGTQSLTSAFSANELFFAIRIHEPFSGRR